MCSSTWGAILATSKNVFQVKDHGGLQSGPAEARQAVRRQLRGVLVPGPKTPIYQTEKGINCTFLSLSDGGELICGNSSLAFHRSIMMRCLGRRARCTKNGDRNDRKAVATGDSVSRKYAEIDAPWKRHARVHRETTCCAEITVVQRSCRHGCEIQPNKTRRVFFRVTRRLLFVPS